LIYGTSHQKQGQKQTASKQTLEKANHKLKLLPGQQPSNTLTSRGSCISRLYANLEERKIQLTYSPLTGIEDTSTDLKAVLT